MAFFRPAEQIGRILALNVNKTLVDENGDGIQFELISIMLKRFVEQGGLIIFLTHDTTFWPENEDKKPYKTILSLCNKIGIPKDEILHMNLTHIAGFRLDIREFDSPWPQYLKFLESLHLTPNYFDPTKDKRPSHFQHCDSSKVNLLLYGLFRKYRNTFDSWLNHFPWVTKISCLLVDGQMNHVLDFNKAPGITISYKNGTTTKIKMTLSGWLAKNPKLFSIDETALATQPPRGFPASSVQLLNDHYLLKLAKLVGIYQEICNHFLLSSKQELSHDAEIYLLAACSAIGKSRAPVPGFAGSLRLAVVHDTPLFIA